MASRTYDLTTRREAALDSVIKWCDPKVLNTCPYKCPSLYTVAQHGTTLCSNDASPFIAFAQYGQRFGEDSAGSAGAPGRCGLPCLLPAVNDVTKHEGCKGAADLGKHDVEWVRHDSDVALRGTLDVFKGRASSLCGWQGSHFTGISAAESHPSEGPSCTRCTWWRRTSGVTVPTSTEHDGEVLWAARPSCERQCTVLSILALALNLAGGQWKSLTKGHLAAACA
jgi:hypothetical protein